MSRKLITGFFIVCIICLAAFSGCVSRDENIGGELNNGAEDLQQKEENPQQDNVPKEPEPTPEPHKDYMEGRFDVSKTPREMMDDVAAEYVEFDEGWYDGVFNPYYCENPLDSMVVDYTQLKFLDIDEDGNYSYGNDRPCYVYDVIKQTDSGNYTYRLVLKKGICFTDGTEVSADDVIFTLKSLSAKMYNGNFDMDSLPVEGINAYNTQVPDEVRREVELIIEAGINPDGTYPPCEGVDPLTQQAFWSFMNAGGEDFAKDIIDYVNETYANNAYVQVFLSNTLTYQMVADSENLRTAYAMTIWADSNSYDAKNNIFTDYNGTTYDLNVEGTLTAKEFWKAILTYRGYDFSDNGVDYERVYENWHIEDYIAEWYFGGHLGVDGISGVIPGTMVCEDGIEREYLDVVFTDEQASPALLDFYVLSRQYYGSNRKNNFPMGAGRYYVEEITDTEVTLVSNDDYPLGAQKRKKLVLRAPQHKPSEEKGE